MKPVRCIFDRYPVLRRVIVNTKTDRAFRGVLWRRRRGYLVLRNAELLKPGGETAAMDGEIVVSAENVDFIQVVG
jgi:small nuclear ribonucleoprotein (snRNP)-like protein